MHSSTHTFDSNDVNTLKKTSYSRATLQTKIIHIGFGAFHRAHQAVYTDLANDLSDENWGIYGINLFRKGPLSEDFSAQDNLATLIEKNSSSSTKRLIRTFTGAMNIHDKGVHSALEKLCGSQVAIVSLTITEKGYCLTPEGRINSKNTLIQQDLASPHTPVSAIGIIVEALRLRKEKALPAFSVMSCDNMPENGHKTKIAVLDYASLIDNELASWIENSATFPSTMVDRIVPAMDDATFKDLATEIGVPDRFGLISEAFKQWVIEDQFCNGRPKWHLSGAMLVDNVLPYEEMKLRMLNGSHSFLAYVGSLCGYKYVYQCMEDPLLKKLTAHLMTQEQALSLDGVLDVDLPAYADSLIERFCNPNIKHQTAQIAMDGSQKLPPRVIDPILTLIKRNLVSAKNPPSVLLFVLAAWMHFIQGKHTSEFQFIDPEANELNARLTRTESTPLSDAMMQFKGIFNAEFMAHEYLIKGINQFYQVIDKQGIQIALAELSTSLRTLK